MPDFNTTSEELNRLDRQLGRHARDRSAGVHATRRLEDRLAESRRRQDEAGTQALSRSVVESRSVAEDLRRRERALREALGEARKAFEPFSDPRRFMGRWRDDIPVLMFPLRLETRFRRVGEGAEARSQLWVRAYPDTCLIDTFEELPGETEYQRTRAYWVSRFRAGTAGPGAGADVVGAVRTAHLEAWRQLVDRLSPGRAHWLTQQIMPTAGQSPSERLHPDDILLVIPTEGGGPDPGERAALSDYYTNLWRAEPDPFPALAAAVGGEDRARDLLGRYVPSGIADNEPRRAEATQRVEVTFLDFPAEEEVDRTVTAWSDPAKVSLLPDRLLLQGFKDGKKVLDEIGPLIARPLTIGPDPGEDIDSVLREAFPDLYAGGAEPPEDRKASAYIEYLKSRSDTRWLFDFQEAQRVGMGFVVDLDALTYRNGFDRLFVVGLRLSGDAAQGKEDLEGLLHHHQYGVTGLGFLPQGTPTNATAPADSAEVSFRRFFEEDPLPFQATDRRTDGQWFTDLLGIDADRSGLTTAANYRFTDQSESLAMQRLIYPATLGYFLENMLETVTDEWDRTVAKEFFRSHVAPRGRLPLLRIGDQPYGVLPVSGRSKGNWLVPGQGDGRGRFRVSGISDHSSALQRILSLLNAVRTDWEEKLGTVAHLWRPGSPHQALLDVLGLHATSVEWDQRMGETVKQFVNRLRLEGGWGQLIGALLGGAYLKRSKDLFLRHGIDLDNLDGETAELPRIMQLLFMRPFNALGGPFIDDRPLSETDPVRAYTPDNRNYLQWLLDAMRDEPRAIRSQSGFSEGDRPQALLYQLLRHATDLLSVDTGLLLYRRANLITSAENRLLRRETDFIGVTALANNAVESRYDLLYRAEPGITNAADGDALVVDHLGELLGVTIGEPTDWHAHRDALEKLTDVPTARLERLLAEHLDCCNYRLDAWLQGFTNLQLRALRYGAVLEREPVVDGAEDGNVRDGIYLGAFGWVENLRPDHASLTLAELTDEQRAVFLTDPDAPAPILDSQNGGYIHAPSLDHATTAAVLRNAYLSQASPDDPDRYAINLSSERVRLGLQLLEGMREGQPLGALLGYHLERALHDSPLELDRYIYDLRTKYPLVANRLADTQLDDDAFDSVEQLGAANVVDGLALVERVNAGGAYPWDVTGLPPSGAAADAIREAVTRLANLEDAVADLALAEGVHQTVKGNFDRAAGNLNAFNKGKIPPVPEVALTPRKGHQLTHRFALHLDPAATAIGSALTETEPAIAAWLADPLPSAADIGVSVEVIAPGGTATSTVRLDQLGWSVTDLLYQLDRASDDQFGNLDEAIQHFVQTDQNLGPAVQVRINYTAPVRPLVSCFELLPLLDDARQLLLSVRNLKPTDIQLPREAREEHDQLAGDPASFNAVRARLQSAIAALETNVITPLTAAGVTVERLEDMNTDAVFATSVTNLDDWVVAYAGAANRLQTFRPLNAHTDLAYSARHGISNLQREVIGKFYADLVSLLAEADDYLSQAAAAATPEETIALLKRVEPLVSTNFFTGTDVVVLTADVSARRDAFAAYLDDLAAFVPRNHASLRVMTEEFLLLTSETILTPLTTRRVDVTEVRNRILVLGQDLLRAAGELAGKAGVLIPRADDLLGPTYADVLAATRQLLGEDFQLLPRFSLPEPAFDELSTAYADREQLLEYQRNDLNEPFPVETWLHGLARVRPFLGRYERLQLYTEDYPGKQELTCVPLQFPWRADDRWLGLEFPEDYPLDEERLLYTAHYARPAGPTANLFCGLLVDEWTEVIPVREEDTGLTFHFDQPATEPPQSWLLALPTEFTGSWDWDDLVGCLHEALDLARLRAIEPRTVENEGYSHLLPTTVSTVTTRPVTPQLNFAAVNGVPLNFTVSHGSS